MLERNVCGDPDFIPEYAVDAANNAANTIPIIIFLLFLKRNCYVHGIAQRDASHLKNFFLTLIYMIILIGEKLLKNL